MAEILVRGGRRLCGEIRVQGSKNAVLPILAASIIHPGVTMLEGVPEIADVWASIDIIRYLGGQVKFCNGKMEIDTVNLESREIPRNLGERMRSSVLFLGALLTRFGEGILYRPGGCAIGRRPVDLHLEGLKCLGVEIILDEKCIKAKASHLEPAEIILTYPSVGATEQLLLAASGANGVTVLKGCAREPEIDSLCQFLVCIGIAQINGIGTDTLMIRGGGQSRDVCFRVPGDRIAAGTYLAAAAITGGNVSIENICPAHMGIVLTSFQKMGCDVSICDKWITLKGPKRLQAIPLIETGPFPEFPTDMQSIFLALHSVAHGTVTIIENVFEARLKTAYELNRMGADIRVDGNKAICRGIERLHGNTVNGTDLRSGAALVVAALSAEGETRVGGYEYVLRGYERFDKKLRELGACVEASK